ncbi:MAG: hypothetical protein P9L88_00030 [Candidatus Tantalella remota]|nr:hypothetical protein [Candidatus Tantalella remota]
MKKFGIIILIVAVALVSSFSVWPAAAGHGYKGGKASSGAGLESKFCGKGKAILAGREKLGLTQLQVTNIRTLIDETKKSLIKRDAEIKTLEVEINTLMWEAPFDIEEVNNLITEKYKLKKEKTQFLVSAYNDLYKGLDAEQVKKANLL